MPKASHSNARYYMVVSLPNHDATIGRFVSPDSTGQHLENPQSLNRYTYCSNNPLRYVDPSGHDYYVFDEGLNDDGELWYSVYSDAEHKNLISIVTGASNLASLFPCCNIEDDYASFTSQLNSPAYRRASDIAISTHTSIEDAFFGGRDFGLTKDVLANIGISGNTNNTINIIAACAGMGFAFWSEFAESGLSPVDYVLNRANPASKTKNATQYYMYCGTVDDIMGGLTVDATKQSNDTWKLSDGSIVHIHTATSDGSPTIDIKRPWGEIIKIRVLGSKP